jgi:Carboxypeptidase regulatory-like domain/TonB dependent receptor
MSARIHRVRIMVLAALLTAATSAGAQEFRGRINGTVTDNTGAVLPGVTVTATGPALIQPQSALTGEDGTYRFPALPAGVYTLTFELAGFQKLTREGIRVVINTTLSVDGKLNVASLQESVTVSGQSPVVDTSTTTVGTNFTKELLTEIPNARDVWAAISQAPGFQMTGYDVGGSHTGTQTGFLAYGIDDQRTTRIEGVNTTEDTGANAGYFDFGSFEELQVSGAGNLADQDTPGSSMNITVKSGGDRFSGSWYSDWEGKNLISDNVPNTFETGFQRDKDGFFVRSALQRGNPIDRQYDINANLGGPVMKQKLWFFYSYRLNDQYKFVLNPDGTVFDTLARSKLTNPYTVKMTYQLSRNNQIIGYINKREKLQALRDFGPGVPLSAAYFQSSRNYPMKLEWTSVLSPNLYLDVQASQWYNFFPLRPTLESGAFDGPYVPGRVEISSTNRFDGGPNTAYQDQKRYKPQFSASLSYFKQGWRGDHSFKFGSEGRHETRKFFADQPFDLVYYDTVLGVTPSELELYNTPNEGINQVDNVSLYVNDNWRLNNRLTLNLGLRYDYYRDGWPEQVVAPNGVPALAGTTDARILDFFATRTVPAATVARTHTIGPRAGFAFDIRGNGKSVIKGFYGRFYFNSSPDAVAAVANPVGRGQLRYRWNDQNGNRLLDNPQELGAFLRTIGSAGGSPVIVDPNLKRPYGDEVSAHFEQELRQGLSGRVSYVYKNIRDEWATVDVSRLNAYTVPVVQPDRGPDGITGNADDGPPINLFDRTAAPEQRVFTNPDDPAYNSDFNSFEVALNRRFNQKWMVLTSFGYTWLDQFHANTSTTNVLQAAGNGKSYDWRPNIRRFGRETSTIWNYKLIGRYVAPWEVGISASYKLQSGRQWGRSLATTVLTTAGSETIRVEPVTANRAPNIGIFDVRLDKSFKIRNGGRLTGMMDIFNLTNDDSVIVFRTATATPAAGEPFGSFREVLALLDPRIIRFGIRYDF